MAMGQRSAEFLVGWGCRRFLKPGQPGTPDAPTGRTLFGQIRGGHEAVVASPNDDDVIGRFGWRHVGPRGWVVLARDPLLHLTSSLRHRQRSMFSHHDTRVLLDQQVNAVAY